MSVHQRIVEELSTLLKLRPYLKAALQESIRKADRRNIKSLAQYYDFLDELVTLVPTDLELLPVVLEFYYIIDQSPEDILKKDPFFQRWILGFAREWGSFLDTPESARGLETFYQDPNYHIEDYFVGPSGWLTYNQFFARQVKPGKRPIEGLCDDSVIVSPADSVFLGQWPISEDSKITAKGLTYSVLQLLDGSPCQDRFKGGVFTHSFLNVNDYHWYHVPVQGTVKEVRRIPGKAQMDVVKEKDGTLAIVDGADFQFTQERGLLMLDSPVGLVAVLPIGMAQVASVNLLPEVGASLFKGEPFGFFLFGGSDIVTLYEARGRVQFTAEIGTHYKQGRQIARAQRV